MKAILSFSALVIGCAIPATAHAQPSSTPAGQGQHQASMQDHSQHQAGQAGVGQHGASAESAPHRMGMQDCKCCCCEAMRKKMQEHGRGAEAESHQGDR